MENNQKKTTRKRATDVLNEIESKIDDTLIRLDEAINNTDHSKSLYEKKIDQGGEKKVIDNFFYMLNGEIRSIEDELKELFNSYEIIKHQNKIFIKLTQKSKPVEVNDSLAKKILKIEKMQLSNSYSKKEEDFIKQIEKSILHTLCAFNQRHHSTEDLATDNFYISEVSTISMPSDKEEYKVYLLDALEVEATEKVNNNGIHESYDEKINPIKVKLPYTFVRMITLNSMDSFFEEQQIKKILGQDGMFLVDSQKQCINSTMIKKKLKEENIDIYSKVIDGKTVFFARQMNDLQTELRIDETLAENIIECMEAEIDSLPNKIAKNIDVSDKSINSLLNVYQFCLEAYKRGYEIEYGKPISVINGNTIAEEECQMRFTALPYATTRISEIDQVLQNLFDGESFPFTQEEFTLIMENVRKGNNVSTFYENLRNEKNKQAKKKSLKRFLNNIVLKTEDVVKLVQLQDMKQIYKIAERIEADIMKNSTQEQLQELNNTIKVLDSYIKDELSIKDVRLKGIVDYIIKNSDGKPKINARMGVKTLEPKSKYTAKKSDSMMIARQDGKIFDAEVIEKETGEILSNTVAREELNF